MTTSQHPPTTDEHAHHRHDARNIRAAIITVSDTRTHANDEGGETIATLLREHGHEVAWRSLVHDDKSAIRHALDRFIAEGAEVILLTGGTGIGRRDVTYETVAAMLERTLPGFGEVFRRLSWDAIGAPSILSRAVAGTIGPTLVFALPGSPKGVRLAMEKIVLPVMPHAVGLLR